MNNQILLSIIVPVYKVEPYINKCLDSLIVSPDLMEKLEVIIVNDGTPDNSAEMSREYVKRYPGTFRQIDKENGGHGSAWNVGLSEAQGKYVKFLDSDDWLTNLEEFMCRLDSCDSDIVLTNYQIYHLQRDEYERRLTSIDFDVERAVCQDLLHSLRYGYIEINFWYACYKTTILKPLWPLFAEKVMYDDSVLSFAPIVYGRTIIAFNIDLYNYLLGREGQSMDPNIQKKNALSYWNCLSHEERVRSQLEEKEIPKDLINCIDEVITQYAHFIFPFLLFLPHKKAKAYMAYIDKTYPFSNNTSSKLWRRYKAYPWWMFYVIEMFRNYYITHR